MCYCNSVHVDAYAITFVLPIGISRCIDLILEGANDQLKNKKKENAQESRACSTNRIIVLLSLTHEMAILERQSNAPLKARFSSSVRQEQVLVKERKLFCILKIFISLIFSIQIEYGGSPPDHRWSPWILTLERRQE